MGTAQVMNHCNHCRGKTMHLAPQTSHILHLFLSIVTVGIWIPVWFLVALLKGKPQCSVCGGQAGVFGYGTTGAKPIAAGQTTPSNASAGTCGACGVGLEGDWARRGICASCLRAAQGQNPPVHTTEDDVVAKLERLAKLRKDGSLTQEEFEREKAKLLG